MPDTILITGANRGIGLELSRCWQRRGDHVIGACRKASPALIKLGIEVIEGVDVADDAAVIALKRALGDRRLNILFNNAGILAREPLDKLDWESIRKQFEVNTLGPLRITAGLLDHLQSGNKVALMTSRMGSISDNTSGGYYGYRISKAALNAVGKSLAEDLRRKGIAVALLHPGYVQTDMTSHGGDVTPEQAVAGLVQRVDELNLENSGGFWHANGQRLPWWRRFPSVYRDSRLGWSWRTAAFNLSTVVLCFIRDSIPGLAQFTTNQ